MTSEPTWEQRVQAVANKAIERASESTTRLQRMMLAVAATDLSRERLADELTRVGQEASLHACSAAAEANARTLSRFAELASSYLSEYAGGVISNARRASIGPPPPVPSAPVGRDATEWMFWNQRYAAWVSDQQGWSARIYRAMVDEAMSDGFGEGDVQAYGTKFASDRLPAYLADYAEASFDSFCDLLAVNDDSVQRLTDALRGAPCTEELVVDVGGVVGSTVATGVMVENNREDATEVVCVPTSEKGFSIGVTPLEVWLAAGESQKVVIQVTMPDAPTEAPVLAGEVRVTGHGDEDLVVLVHAAVSRREPGALSVRVLGEP